MTRQIRFLLIAVMCIGGFNVAVADDVPVVDTAVTENTVVEETPTPDVVDVLKLTSRDYVDKLHEQTKHAENIEYGKLDTEHLNVYGKEDTVKSNMAAGDTVAGGDDSRFDTLSVGRPDITVASDRVLVWVEE